MRYLVIFISMRISKRWDHWALQYLEKARAAIFEAKNMARIGPDWSPL